MHNHFIKSRAEWCCVYCTSFADSAFLLKNPVRPVSMKLCKCNQLVLKLSDQDVHSITDQRVTNKVEMFRTKELRENFLWSQQERKRKALHCILKTFKYWPCRSLVCLYFLHPCINLQKKNKVIHWYYK